MNKIFKGKSKIKIIICILMFLIIAFLVNFINIFNNPFRITKDTEFEVKNGDTINSVISRLNDKGLIRNATVFKVYIKYKKFQNKIKPGYYEITSGESMDTFVTDLNNGVFDKNMIKLTIPEGYDINEIGDLLDKKGIISKSAFIKACNEYELPTYIKKDSKRKNSLEGFLFPDTYLLKKGMSGNVIIKIMLSNFEDQINKLSKKDGVNIDKNNYDSTIIMASIVEREAEEESERSTIASVFYNRLKINMKLQSCATVEYALGYHKDKLYDKDTQFKSVYNTYLVKGLPEGPICSPGINSIEAALKPRSTNYIYFVSKNDGTHFFTSDVKEFEKVKKQTQGSY